MSKGTWWETELTLDVAALPRNFGPYATLMLSGFVAGILGHLTRQRWLVAIGVMLIAFGVLLLPLALTAETSDEPAPPPPPTLDDVS